MVEILINMQYEFSILQGNIRITSFFHILSCVGDKNETTDPVTPNCPNVTVGNCRSHDEAGLLQRIYNISERQCQVLCSHECKCTSSVFDKAQQQCKLVKESDGHAITNCGILGGPSNISLSTCMESDYYSEVK